MAHLSCLLGLAWMWWHICRNRRIGNEDKIRSSNDNDALKDTPPESGSSVTSQDRGYQDVPTHDDVFSIESCETLTVPFIMTKETCSESSSNHPASDSRQPSQTEASRLTVNDSSIDDPPHPSETSLGRSGMDRIVNKAALRHRVDFERLLAGPLTYNSLSPPRVGG